MDNAIELIESQIAIMLRSRDKDLNDIDELVLTLPLKRRMIAATYAVKLDAALAQKELLLRGIDPNNPPAPIK